MTFHVILSLTRIFLFFLIFLALPLFFFYFFAFYLIFFIIFLDLQSFFFLAFFSVTFEFASPITFTSTSDYNIIPPPFFFILAIFFFLNIIILTFLDSIPSQLFLFLEIFWQAIKICWSSIPSRSKQDLSLIFLREMYRQLYNLTVP